MPARQRGYARKRGDSWLACWRDSGRERSRGGYPSKTEALDYANEKAADAAAEQAAIRFGDKLPTVTRVATVDELCDTFLDRHGRFVDPATTRKLERELRKARHEFGDRHPDSLHRLEVEDWQATLPSGSRHGVFRAFRQALARGEARGLVERNPSLGVKNPKPKRQERKPIVPFETWAEIEAVCDELDPRDRAIPIFATGTGLGPGEWIALERADIDRDARLVRVCKRFAGGVLKQGTKTVPERFVPLRQRVLDALDAMPPRIDTPLLFPAARGGHIEIEKWRWRKWTPALRAAGLAPRGAYTMRHTFITWALEDNSVPVAQLATIAGTSIREIEDTYHRWLTRTDDRLLAAFDTYDQAAQAAEGGK
jgi:integrase